MPRCRPCWPGPGRWVLTGADMTTHQEATFSIDSFEATTYDEPAEGSPLGRGGAVAERAGLAGARASRTGATPGADSSRDTPGRGRRRRADRCRSGRPAAARQPAPRGARGGRAAGPPTGRTGSALLRRLDVARIRGLEAAVAGQGRTRLGAGAVTADGTMVAFTELVIPRSAPEQVYQWDTLVLAEHRGHRLGTLVKLANGGSPMCRRRPGRSSPGMPRRTARWSRSTRLWATASSAR